MAGNDVIGARNAIVGRLLKSYREDDEHGGGPLKQTELLQEMTRQGRKSGSLHPSAISHYESGSRRASLDYLDDISYTLSLSEDERDVLLELAGHRSPRSQAEQDTEAAAGRALDSRMETLQEKFRDAAASVVGSGEPFDPLGFVRDSLKKAVIPGAYIGLVGSGLGILGLDGTMILLLFAAAASGVVLAQGLSRWGKSDQVGELFFVSVFFLLNTPNLQSIITGMDIYGFYSMPAITGTALPPTFAMAANLSITVVAAIIFDMSWKRQYGPRGIESASGRALFIAFPPIAFVYLCMLTFSNSGAWIFFLIVLGILFGAFWGIIAIRDHDVEPPMWVAQFILAAVAVMIMLLTTFGVAGMLVTYMDPSTITAADHSMIWSWETDFDALGYPEDEYLERMRVGLIWMSVAAIGYLSIVVGGYLMVMVYRHAILPARARQQRV